MNKINFKRYVSKFDVTMTATAMYIAIITADWLLFSYVVLSFFTLRFMHRLPIWIAVPLILLTFGVLVYLMSVMLGSFIEITKGRK